MIGYEIKEVAKVVPEYERLSVNGRGVGVYYSARHRHALFTRHGVVFATLANLTPDEAQKAWHGWADRIDYPLRHLPNDRHDWYELLVRDAIMTSSNAHGLYLALDMVIKTSQGTDGRRLKSIRPAALADALELATTTRNEVREDIRDATRPARPQTPEEAEEDRAKEAVGNICSWPFFVKGYCVDCGLTVADHDMSKEPRP
jgi:hypothetical protein